MSRLEKIGMHFLVAYARRLDFTGISGVDRVYKHLKPGDATVLAKQLKHTRVIRDSCDSIQNASIRVMDIGGADGLMLLTLLKILELSAMVYLVEPNQTRISDYHSRADKDPNTIKTFGFTSSPIQEIKSGLPKVDLILASHSLYYCRSDWYECHSIENHFFTKLFLSLNEHGVLSIVIQSCLGGEGTHEFLEDLIYPLLEGVKHEKNPYYANAEMVEVALSRYNKQLIFETGSPASWKYHEDVAVTAVPLNNINLQPDQSGNYVQKSEVAELLKFYLKGNDFNRLPLPTQKYIIENLKKYFLNAEGVSVVHYNKVISIEMTDSFHTLIQGYRSGEATHECLKAKL